MTRFSHANPHWFNAGFLRGMTVRDASITVLVPSMLRDYCAGASELAMEAARLRGLLEKLEQQYPSLYRNICDETGAVRRHVNLFINKHHMRDCHGLETLLASGDVVTILPAVSGG